MKVKGNKKFEFSGIKPGSPGAVTYSHRYCEDVVQGQTAAGPVMVIPALGTQMLNDDSVRLKLMSYCR